MRIKSIIFMLLLLVTIAFGQGGDAAQKKPEIEIESTNPDGSIVLIINGKRFRALTEGQMKTVYENQVERNSYRNNFLECRSLLQGKNIAD